MTISNKLKPWLALAVTLASAGCVQNRAARNGVFNENQYLRKDFLVRPAADGATDPGWFWSATITQTSTPNLLSSVNGAGLFAGAQSAGQGFARFTVSQDKLQLVDLREVSNDPVSNSQGLRTPAIINAWPATNVDLKYRINLDGETTNFYEENQENDWQARQWVKLNFGKNDLNDFQAFFGNLNPVLTKCTNSVDHSVTLVPSSFNVDPANGYFEFAVSLTVPIEYAPEDAATCAQAFGLAGTLSAANNLARYSVTLNILYSFVRPANMPGNTFDGSYVPLEIGEKDPIRHKYGPIDQAFIYRDSDSGLLGAKQYAIRFHPNKDIVWYYAPGVPDEYKKYFSGTDGTGGVVAATNAIFAKAGAKGRLKVLNYNDDQSYGDGAAKSPRKYGDVRYSFIVWHSDLDNGTGLLGVAQFQVDPRSGQVINSSVNVFTGGFKDSVQQRLDLFLQTAGAEYLTPAGEFDDNKYPPSCNDGDTIPLLDANVAAQINSTSTVYGKMQQYLQKPISQFGNLGPVNFLPTHDKDFYDAYFAVLPYQIYADPEANQFVWPDGSVFGGAMAQNWQGLQQVAEFEKLAARIDHGEEPWDVKGQNGVASSLSFNHELNRLVNAVTDYEHVKARLPRTHLADDISLFSYIDIYRRNGRHCVGGKWETRQQYVDRLFQSLNQATLLHEFGHAMSLAHNFMGSIDQRNFPTDKNGSPTLYASSIMDYNQQLSEAFFTTNDSTWPPFDAASIAFVYGNNLDTGHVGPVATPKGATAKGISGQISATVPWNDPLGFTDATTERAFLRCSDEHVAYTPLCRRYDLGVTPSEILANEIQQREWNYLWTNFRLYHKYFDLTSYPQRTALQFAEYRRFLAMWDYDWSPGELTNTLRLIGVTPPAGSTAGDYFAQLTNKFNKDISLANQLAAAYHRAIIDQSSGERPYITVFDPFYGDTTQQGIQLDKLISISSFSSLWPAISNFDPSQSGATQLSSSWGQDGAYNQLANGVILDFLGAAFATYTYAQIGPIAAFAEETHSSFWPTTSYAFTAAPSWIGGLTFYRERDFLDYLHSMADKFGFENCDENGLNCQLCTSLDNCNWDPRTLQVKPGQIYQSDRFNRFTGPDGRTYIWMYLPTRNAWVLADKDRNVALYTLILNWSSQVVNAEDDGYDGAAYFELKVKYAIDAYQYFNDFQPNTP